MMKGMTIRTSVEKTLPSGKKNWLVDIISKRWMEPQGQFEHIVEMRLECPRDPYPSTYGCMPDHKSDECIPFDHQEAMALAGAGMLGEQGRDWWLNKQGALCINEHAQHAAEDFIRECSGAWHRLQAKLR